MTNRNSRKHLSATELGAVLSYVKIRAGIARGKGTTRAVVDELIVLLLAGAGLRPHELRALRIGDLPGTHGEKALWIRDKNGGVARKVNISDDLAERLTRFVRFYRNGAKEGDLLLESKRGGPLGYMSLCSKVRRIGREAGISKLSPVTLRLTYLQQLYEAEQDLRYVQQQTGYASRRAIAKHLKANGDRDDTEGNCVDPPQATAIGPRGVERGPTPTCEVCGVAIPTGRGERIESGQLLCDGCLRYFRRT